MFQIYIVFHKKIYDLFYENISEENKRHLILYGVKHTCNHNTNIRTLYEEDLHIYNPLIQKKRFNEGSCIYHIYKNKLYENFSYIGFFQYDMKLNNGLFDVIKNRLNNNIRPCIFGSFAAIEDSVNRLDGSLQFINTSITNFGSALDNYNNFFNKTYTLQDVKKNHFIMCNTYIIHISVYKKMMSWFERLFECDINQKELEEIYFKNPGILVKGSPESIINPGHLLEAFTAMFLSLEIYEGIDFEYLPIEHDHNYKCI